jgi:trimeric autotransporter adhesin
VFKGTRTLNVLGGVLADSVRTALSGDWADHVFRNDYPLRSLQELQEYILSNEHLPGIPTQAEVQRDGINLGEMDSKLLEKIEELTLYVLELKKENQEQQKEIDKLKRRRK